MTSTLGFDWRRREREYPDSQTDVTYLDVQVDGVSLETVLGMEDRDHISGFGRGWDPQPAADELLGRAAVEPIEPGRITLYVCPECGDIYCGAVTARLSILDMTVTWSDFADENGLPIDDGSGYFEPIDAGEITFDRAQYEAAISMAIARIAQSATHAEPLVS